MACVPPSARREFPFQTGCGIGIYGPAIDDCGNSITGVMMLKKLAKEWDLSIF
jgi:glutaminase